MTPSPAPPRLTICIPAYNQPGFLREALESLCRQGLPRGEFEVLVCDDASPTPLVPVLDAFRDRLSIRYERAPANIGHIANFARAASLVETPFVSFLPHDDLVAPGHFRALLPLVEADDAITFAAGVVIGCRYPGAPDSHVVGTSLRRESDAGFASPERWTPVAWQAATLLGTPFSMIGAIFRTSAFHGCRDWMSFPLWHDRVWCSEIGFAGDVVTVPWCSGTYRVGRHQTSAKLWDAHLAEFRKASAYVLDRCRAARLPVLEFWTEYLCAAVPHERAHWLKQLHRSMPEPAFMDLKRRCEAKSKSRVTLGGRIGNLGLPWRLEMALRSVLGR